MTFYRLFIDIIMTMYHDLMTLHRYFTDTITIFYRRFIDIVMKIYQ